MAYQETAPDLLRKIAELEKRIRILENADRLTNASIGSGGLTVQDEGKIVILGPSGEVLVTLDGSGLTATGGTISGADVSGATIEGGVFRTDVSPNNRVEIRRQTGYENGGIFFYDDGSAGGVNIGSHKIYASPDQLNIEFGDSGFPSIVLSRDGSVFVEGSLTVNGTVMNVP